MSVHLLAIFILSTCSVHLSPLLQWFEDIFILSVKEDMGLSLIPNMTPKVSSSPW